ncbi:benzoate carboxyl methyltransferase-like [Apium graveolens]|uniref:benzoate carboxyl methyltransferase-like n=1 Tax=Apium graveolens TaxID=4045 RepID=UPI003D7AD068
MDVVNVLHMNAENRKCSYAENSTLQKTVILKARKVLEETIKDYGSHGFPQCFKLADLGCSSGPNSLFLIANIVDGVHAFCQKKNLKAPDEYQVFLNDLPNNDFNAVFKMTPQFYSNLENEIGPEKSEKCFICGVPGSFYKRLFPSDSLHFVHSSYSVHWLSQVPRELLDINKGNIYIPKVNPAGVYEAYFNQFTRDFTAFLHMRSEEMVSKGRMVLTLIGRSTADPACNNDCCHLYGLLAKSLHDMVAEGLIHEEDFNSFNLPIYTSCTDELKAIIESENSFTIDRLETFEVNCDTRDENEKIKSDESSGRFIANTIRAVMEPMLASHFGNTFMDKLFERYAMHVTEHLSREEPKYFNIVISLTKKCK